MSQRLVIFSVKITLDTVKITLFIFAQCENNTADNSMKITTCEDITIIQWIKPGISRLKM